MNTSTQLMEQVIKLVARTGLFFAKADGDYSEREQAFIEAFIAQLAQEGSAEEARALVGDVADEHITLDQLVADTRQVLQQLLPNEADMVKLMLYAFITDMVAADGCNCTAEQEAMQQWRDALAG